MPATAWAGNGAFSNLGPVGPVIWSGPAEAIDGDTLVLGGRLRVRIFGIDAPEQEQVCHASPITMVGGGTSGFAIPQPYSSTQYTISSAAEYQCGKDAAVMLAAVIRNLPVRCEARDRDRYGRIVATCSTEAGDIGSAMVVAGWAVDYERYSHGKYAEEQAEAKAANRGIWSGHFEMPEQWRKARR
jgi:endonuclease YncB( thermonuclease family)